MRDGPECNANELDEPYQETRRNSAKPITAPEEQPALQGSNQPEEISAELHPEPLDPISPCLPNENQDSKAKGEEQANEKPAIPSEIVEPCADTIASAVPIEDGNRTVSSPCLVDT